MKSPAATLSIDRLLRRDRLIAAIGLTLITLLAWIYLAGYAHDNRAMAAMNMPDMHQWGLADWLALFVMWSVMMTAMMLPSAAPLIMLVLGVFRRRGGGSTGLSGLLFVSGYLVAWTSFSVVAAVTQFVLHRAALLTDAMSVRSTIVGGAILLIAGIYQWLPLKTACLSHCQSPLAFLGRHWREGPAGALAMGIHHGVFCVGCCWALMLPLFAVGVMNLLWVGAIAAFVLVEKLMPPGLPVGRTAGVFLIACGLFQLAARTP